MMHPGTITGSAFPCLRIGERSAVGVDILALEARVFEGITSREKQSGDITQILLSVRFEDGLRAIKFDPHRAYLFASCLLEVATEMGGKIVQPLPEIAPPQKKLKKKESNKITPQQKEARRAACHFIGLHRHKTGLSQLDFAKRCGISDAAVYQYEYMHIYPSAATFMRICRALKVKPPPEILAHLYLQKSKSRPTIEVDKDPARGRASA